MKTAIDCLKTVSGSGASGHAQHPGVSKTLIVTPIHCTTPIVIETVNQRTRCFVTLKWTLFLLSLRLRQFIHKRKDQHSSCTDHLGYRCSLFKNYMQFFWLFSGLGNAA